MQYLYNILAYNIFKPLKELIKFTTLSQYHIKCFEEKGELLDLENRGYAGGVLLSHTINRVTLHLAD